MRETRSRTSSGPRRFIGGAAISASRTAPSGRTVSVSKVVLTPLPPLRPLPGRRPLAISAFLSKPGVEDDLAGVLLGVFAHAIERAGTHPQDHPPEVIRVALDLGVEEVDGAALAAQELVGVIQVLPGFRDRPLGVVFEPLVLVSADDVPGLERLDLVDRVPPRHKASDRALPEIHVHAVVDRVTGDDQLEIWNVEDGGVVAVGVADLNDHQIVPFEDEAVA